MTNSIKHYRPEIDGLRMIAVMAVTLYHLKVSGFSGGYTGVDVFFVISGFLITGNIIRELETEKFSFSMFFAKRVRRIFPALLATVICTLLLSLLVSSPLFALETAWQAFATLLSVANIYFWLGSGYFDTEAYLKPLLHMWSLGVEEQFYLFWPLLLTFFVKFGPTAKRLLIFFCILSGTILTNYYLQIDASATFFLLPFRISEFAIGAFLAVIPTAGKNNSRINDLGTLIGLILIGVSVFTFDHDTLFPGTSALLPCTGAGLIIYFGQSRIGKLLLSHPLSTNVGKISYSLYLVHWPVIVLTEYVLMRELTAIETPIALAIIFTLAISLYKYIELPFRDTKAKSFIISWPKLFTYVGSAWVGSLIIALATIRLEGIPQRINSITEISSLKSVNQLHAKYYGGAECTIPRCETQPNNELPKIYVIGDSHARALYQGLKDTIPEFNFIIYGPSACPMYSLRHREEQNAHTKKCLTAQSLAYKELTNAKNPIVLMTQHWFTRALGRHPEEELNNPYPFSSMNDYSEYVLTEIEEFKKALELDKIILIGGIPKYDAPLSPLDCATRPFALESCTSSSIVKPILQQHFIFNKRAHQTDKEILSFIDPFDVLCTEKTCKNFTDAGMPIYSDPTHLSTWGSQMLIEAIKENLLAHIQTD